MTPAEADGGKALDALTGNGDLCPLGGLQRTEAIVEPSRGAGARATPDGNPYSSSKELL